MDEMMGRRLRERAAARGYEPASALTKREYMAVAAMNGIAANGSVPPTDAGKHAVEFADALLLALERA